MKLFYLLFICLLFISCDKDLSVPVGKGNYIAVSSSEISSITTNSAKCSFIVNDLNNETVVEQGLCWEITSKPTTANKKMTVTLGTGTFPTNLTNLNPNQTYYVRSYVKLNTGVTIYGDEKYFITKDILPATFRESTISNITATSAQVTGSILDNGGSNLSDVGIVYGYSTNPTIQDIRVSAGASATSFTISLSGLIQNTTYNLRPYAINSKGVLSYGTNVLFQTSSSSATLTTGLVAYYPFNGNANDKSGNGNNGIVTGAILTADRFGNPNSAYLFSNNYIRIPNSKIYDFNNYTVSFWASTFSTLRQVPIVKLNYDDATNEQFGFVFNDLNVNGFQFATKYNNNCTPGIGWQKNEVINILTDGSFHHFAGSVNGDIINLYIDGLLVKSIIGPSKLSSSCFNGDIQIGRNWKSFNNFFQGKIDDIAIWNRALGDKEIKDLYNTYELIK
jgi:hypothetical protein